MGFRRSQRLSLDNAMIAPLPPAYHHDQMLKLLIAHRLQANYLAAFGGLDAMADRAMAVEQIIAAYRGRQHIGKSIAYIQITWRRCEHAYALWNMSASILPSCITSAVLFTHSVVHPHRSLCDNQH